MNQKVLLLFVVALILCVTGCQKEKKEDAVTAETSETPKTPETAETQESLETNDKVEKKSLKLPDAYEEGEVYTGDFTISREGYLELFVKETETQKIYYYDMDEKDEWVKHELKNKTIHKKLTKATDEKPYFSKFQRCADGKLYCVYETVWIQDDPYADIGDANSEAYLVCLGADGTKFEKHRMLYSNSGGEYEDGSYLYVDSYTVMEDGKVLVQYADNHCEIYSLAEKKVVKEIPEELSKYGLYYIENEIYGVGEDWMSFDVLDIDAEEPVQKYEHNFKRLAKRPYYVSGYGERRYFLDGNGIFYLDKDDKELHRMEGANDENAFDSDSCTIYGFKADEYGNLYVYHEINSGESEAGVSGDVSFVKYTMNE